MNVYKSTISQKFYISSIQIHVTQLLYMLSFLFLSTKVQYQISTAEGRPISPLCVQRKYFLSFYGEVSDPSPVFLFNLNIDIRKYMVNCLAFVSYYGNNNQSIKGTEMYFYIILIISIISLYMPSPIDFTV